VLARRKAPRMRQDAPQCGYPRHRKYVRGFRCIVPHCDRDEPVECCHVRAGLPATVPGWARGGTSKKPHDAFTFPACRYHHALQHAVGEREFPKRYFIDPFREALDLARNSPVPEVRSFIKELKL